MSSLSYLPFPLLSQRNTQLPFTSKRLQSAFTLLSRLPRGSGAGGCQMQGRRAIGTGEKRKLNVRFFPIHSFRFRLEAVAAVCDFPPWGCQQAPAASSIPSVPNLFQKTEPPAHLSCCSAVTHRARRCKFASKIAACKKLASCSIKTRFIFPL